MNKETAARKASDVRNAEHAHMVTDPTDIAAIRRFRTKPYEACDKAKALIRQQATQIEENIDVGKETNRGNKETDS